MTFITLSEAKLHLRVDGTDEDSLIGLYIDAAEISAAEYLNRVIYADETAKGTDATGIVINSAIKAAVLLHIGTLFTNRESVIQNGQELPMGCKWLLNPYRLSMGV